jgi:hypothetical protein
MKTRSNSCLNEVKAATRASAGAFVAAVLGLWFRLTTSYALTLFVAASPAAALTYWVFELGLRRVEAEPAEASGAVEWDVGLYSDRMRMAYPWEGQPSETDWQNGAHYRRYQRYWPGDGGTAAGS